MRLRTSAANSFAAPLRRCSWPRTVAELAASRMKATRASRSPSPRHEVRVCVQGLIMLSFLAGANGQDWRSPGVLPAAPVGGGASGPEMFKVHARRRQGMEKSGVFETLFRRL